MVVKGKCVAKPVKAKPAPEKKPQTRSAESTNTKRRSQPEPEEKPRSQPQSQPRSQGPSIRPCLTPLCGTGLRVLPF
jgi:hypothetical protein